MEIKLKSLSNFHVFRTTSGSNVDRNYRIQMISDLEGKMLLKRNSLSLMLIEEVVKYSNDKGHQRSRPTPNFGR